MAAPDDGWQRLAVQDGSPSAQRPYRNSTQALAAVTAWLQDGVDIMKHCRVDEESAYFRGSLVELGLMALRKYDEYFDWATPSEVLHAEVEKIVAEAEGRS